VIEKAGTPTMGGLMFLAGIAAGTLLWADLTDVYVWVVLLVTMAFGFLGFLDDYAKVTRQTTAGLSSMLRLLVEAGVCHSRGVPDHQVRPGDRDEPHLATSVAFPIFKKALLDLGLFYLAFGALVIMGSSNAVNFTDGLDGLATVPVMIAAGAFGLIAYLVGNARFADYLQLHAVPGVGEVGVYCAAMVGSCLGFLWYNAPPAKIFMGDSGSLALGGGLGAVAVATKHEIVLAIVGGLFVLETVSVVVQVTSFKLTGKRVFRMAPIHHHFERLGWAEPHNRDPVLDHFGHAGARRPGDPEAAIGEGGRNVMIPGPWL